MLKKSILMASLSILVSFPALTVKPAYGNTTCTREFWSRDRPSDFYWYGPSLRFFPPNSAHRFTLHQYRETERVNGRIKWKKNGEKIFLFWYQYTQGSASVPNSLEQLIGADREFIDSWLRGIRRIDISGLKFFYTDSCYNDEKFDPGTDPPEPECPNLNVTIRGTLLPARRGTARISGDWCK